MPLICVGSTLRAFSRALPWLASSVGESVKRDSVMLRLMLSQSPWPMNLGGSGALVLRRFSFRLMVRPLTPAAAHAQTYQKDSGQKDNEYVVK